MGHTLASVQASEDALGIVPDEETVLMRKFLLHAETIQSHILHLYFLVAPDVFGVGSVVPLATSHPEIVKMALAAEEARQPDQRDPGRPQGPSDRRACRAGSPAGRRPRKSPGARSLLLIAKPDLDATVELFRTIKMPELDRRDRVRGVDVEEEYAFYNGDIASSLGKVSSPARPISTGSTSASRPHSAAKHVKAEAETYAVGALCALTTSTTRSFARGPRAWRMPWGSSAPVTNPFHNNTAQLVETLHCWEDALVIADELLERKGYVHRMKEPTKHGRGVGATEVPRGILFHDYTFNAEGRHRERQLHHSRRGRTW